MPADTSAAADNSGNEPSRLMVNKHQFARIIGVSARTIDRYDERGVVPKPVKLGGAIRWLLAEIHDWTAAGCPKRSDWEAIKKARLSKV